MDETDRSKMIKRLRMFSSDFDGEVASAARRVHSIIKTHALDWDDLIVAEGRSGKSDRSESRRQEHTRDDDEISLIRRCAELDKCLTSWESEFIGSIAESVLQWGHLTPKQRGVLDRIITKLKLNGLWDD